MTYGTYESLTVGDALTVCTEIYNSPKLQINLLSSKYCLG